MAILCVNAGSSSLKFSLHPLSPQHEVLPALMQGNYQGLEPAGQPEVAWTHGGASDKGRLPPSDRPPFEQALASLQQLLADRPGLPPLQAVAHRVVHGGSRFRDSVLLSDTIVAQLDELCDLSPLHQPANIAGVRAFRSAFPSLPQVACFDTAFHASIPAQEFSYALPRELSLQGLRRYGFHGLSYQYLSGHLRGLSLRAEGRVLLCHLGNGSSLCAVHRGASVATTMGFTPLDGLVMGTRSGSLDPGVLLFLLQQGWDHARLEKLLFKQSGLLGVSGVSADMRTLRASNAPEAREAIELFTHRIVREAGAMIACMDGVDALVFAGGIGENDAELRAAVCDRLAWLGVHLDARLNTPRSSTDRAIHAPHSSVEVWVIPTDEGIVAAREAARLAL